MIIFQIPFPPQRKFLIQFRQLLTIFSSSLLLGLTVFSGVILSPNLTLAQNSYKTPEKLAKLLEKIDRAASRQDLENVIYFYSNDFTNSDGLNRESLEAALKKFWQLYK